MGFDCFGRLQMHCQYHVPIKPSILKWSKGILIQIELALQDKGVQEYWTVVDSVEGFRYCEFMGFHTTKETFLDKYEYMKKRLV
jgi:hypothetical protein